MGQGTGEKGNALGWFEDARESDGCKGDKTKGGGRQKEGWEK